MNIPFSEQAMTLACRLSLIEVSLESANKPHTFCQLLKNFLETIRSEDPNKFHYDIARSTLQHLDKEALKNEQAVDMLARECVKACHTFDEKFTLPANFTKLIKRDQTTPNDPYLIIVDLSKTLVAVDEQFFTTEGNAIWDREYLALLESIGATGKKQSKELSKKLRSTAVKWDSRFWFRKQSLEGDVHFFQSPAFLGLAAVLWEDIVERRVKFAHNNVPSLTTNVHLPMQKVLSPKTRAIEIEQQMQLINGIEMLGTIDVPAIPTHIMSIIFKGVRKLNSIYSHRIFRFEVQEPFRRWCRGETDYRVIKLEGGRTELAERLGFKSNKAVTILGEILYAQAHLRFNHKGVYGNLIQLTTLPSQVTKREEALLITVGTMLLPYHTFEAYKKGECGLLIPLLKDPPLIGANRFHANLYCLQMDVMAEFSKYSKELYTAGCIKISKSKWNEMCNKNAIPVQMAGQIHDRWIQDGDDGAKFLDLITPEYYTLAIEYAKELAFLKEQGKMRVQAKVAGKISSQAKKKVGQKRSSPIN